MKKKLAIIAVGLTAACSQNQEINTLSTNVKKEAGFVESNVTTYREVVSRSLNQPDSSKAPKEILGASCRLQGHGFSADYVTPAKINIPVFDRASLPITVTCKKGEESASRRFDPVNLTAKSRIEANRQVGRGFGLIGALVSEMASAATDAGGYRQGDEYSYDNFLVIFK